MIITRTPLRISFFGGGTDYEPWFSKHGGAVLSTTINKYCWVTVRELPPFFKHNLRVVYSRIEEVIHREELNNSVVRETLAHLGIDSGYEIHHDGDLPARSGMGSSSAFCVGLLKAFGLHRHSQLAETATHIERNLIGDTVGSQDQTAAAYGGFNVIRFPENKVIPVQENGIFKKLMLFYVGGKRIASDVAKSYDLKHPCLHLMQGFVEDGIKYLKSDHDSFGDLLNTAWMEKRQLSSKISNPVIDAHYITAMKNGALGGKLLGAGGGGFLLFYVPEEKQERVKNALGLLHLPIEYEPNGSTVIYKEDT